MFTQDTAFILGAGASWHYGYPTGEDLVRDVATYATEIAKLLKSENITWGNLESTKYIQSQQSPAYYDPYGAIGQLLDQCNLLAEKLNQVNPPVIDYFLERNPDLQKVGQMIIAWVLLACEAKSILRDGNSDWYRFLTYQLSLNCKSPDDLSKNKITFITFNYDLSLERNLYKSLSSTEYFSSTENCVDDFFDDARFLHIYGELKQDFKKDINKEQQKLFQNLAFSDVFEFINAFDKAYEASQGICTINNVNKGNQKDVIDTAIRRLHHVDTVYILGYGFDQNNNRILNLQHALGYDSQRIFFTNYEDNNIVNKRVSQLLLGTPEVFMPTENPIKGSWSKPPYYEKSIRSVYEALSKDFDLQLT